MRSAIPLDTAHLVVVIKPLAEISRFPDVNRDPFPVSETRFFGKDVITGDRLKIRRKGMNPVTVRFSRFAGPVDSFCFGSCSHLHSSIISGPHDLRGCMLKSHLDLGSPERDNSPVETY